MNYLFSLVCKAFTLEVKSSARRCTFLEMPVSKYIFSDETLTRCSCTIGNFGKRRSEKCRNVIQHLPFPHFVVVYAARKGRTNRIWVANSDFFARRAMKFVDHGIFRLIIFSIDPQFARFGGGIGK
jgi:hypothetical protein